VDRKGGVELSMKATFDRLLEKVLLHDHTPELDTRYLKLDQTTPQTVSNGIPLLDAEISDFNNLDQFINKRYVDSAVSSLIVDWYVINTDSGVEDYKLTTIDIADLGDTQQSISKNGILDGDYLAGWISPDGQTPTVLPLGIYNLSIYLEKTDGNKDIQVYWQLVERKSDNSETVLATSSYSDIIGTDKQQYIAPLILDEDVIPASGSRVVGKVYAHVTGTGNDPSLTIYYENNSMTRWSMPTTLEVISNQFVDVSGDTMTGPLVLSGDPTSPLEAATKQYVDDEIAGVDLSGKANVALDNLASVAVNTSLIPADNSSIDLGAPDKYWANLYADKWIVPNSVGTVDIYGWTSGQTRHQGISLENKAGYPYIVLKGAGDDGGQIWFESENYTKADGNAASIIYWQDDLRITAKARMSIHGSSVRLYDGTVVYLEFDASKFIPYNNSGIDLGSSTNYWKNTYANKLYLNSTAYLDGSTAGKVGLTGILDINSDKIRIETAKTPSSASDTGDAGDICWDSNYLYVCVAANTWKRAALSSW